MLKAKVTNFAPSSQDPFAANAYLLRTAVIFLCYRARITPQSLKKGLDCTGQFPYGEAKYLKVMSHHA